MLTRIRGVLESIDGTRAVVAPEGQPGMAYEVLVPAYLAVRLKAGLGGAGVGEMVTLRTIEYHESLNQGTSFIPRLIGFTSERERAFFELFTTVKGLGNKRALRALAIEPGAVAAAIMAKDARALAQLPEIGKRLAETVIAELSGKVDGFADLAGGAAAAGGEAPARPVSEAPEADDAVSALVALGQTRPDAERVVVRVMQKDPKLRATDEILRAALSSR